MKDLRLIPIAIITLSIISINSIHGQEISTVGEIYDFDVGDIFHFDVSASTFHTIKNIEILEKQFSPNEDTITYIREISSQTNSMEIPWWVYDYYSDTISFYDLDSLIRNVVDSVYSTQEEYNNRLINLALFSGIDHHGSYKFVKGCGQAFFHYYTWDGLYYAYITDELVYYKKGDEEWGNPIYVSVEENNFENCDILVYPNPANEILNFNIQNQIFNELFTIELLNLQGQLVSEERNIRSSHYTMDVADLKAGVYFYVIKKQNEIIQQGKLIIK